jgi:hypothetical protein
MWCTTKYRYAVSITIITQYIDIDDKGGKVIIEQYSPYLLYRDQLPSEGKVPQYPISDSYRHNKEHLDHPMMNESNSEYNMSQEHVKQIHIWW